MLDVNLINAIKDYPFLVGLSLVGGFIGGFSKNLFTFLEKGLSKEVKELKQNNVKYEKQIEDLKQEYKNQIEDLETEYKKEILEIKTQHKKEILEYTKRLDDLEKELLEQREINGKILGFIQGYLQTSTKGKKDGLEKLKELTKSIK